MEDEEIKELLREVGLELPDVEADGLPSDDLPHWDDKTDLEGWG